VQKTTKYQLDIRQRGTVAIAPRDNCRVAIIMKTTGKQRQTQVPASGKTNHSSWSYENAKIAEDG